MNKTAFSRQLPLLALLAFGGVAIAQTLDNSGRVFPYSGYLEVDGAPANGSYAMTVELYTQATGGTACDSLSYASVGVAQGRFQILLEDVSDACFAGTGLWLSLAVAPAGDTPVPLSPSGGGRVAVGAVPFAAQGASFSRFFAEVVETLGLDVDGDATVTGTITAGEVVGGTVTTNAVNANTGSSSNFNGLYLSANYVGLPDQGVVERAEIANDTDVYEALMIVGNRSFGDGSRRKVQLYDDVTVSGDLKLIGSQLGPYTAYAVNTDHVAPTDGFVISYLNVTLTGSACYGFGVVDGATWAGMSAQVDGSIYLPFASMSFPVKRGSSFRVNTALQGAGVDCFAYAHFVPLAP